MAEQTTDKQKVAASLRLHGIPEDVIQSVLGAGSEDTALIGKQYDQSAYLRKGALDSGSKTPFGAVAQGIMGYQAAKKDEELLKLIRELRDERVRARRGYFEGVAGGDPTNTGASQGQGGDQMQFGTDYGMDYGSMFERNPEYGGFGGGTEYEDVF